MPARPTETRTVPLKSKMALMAGGAVGAVILSVTLYEGEIVFPALMGACFGLAVAATGQRRMRTGQTDFRARRVQAFYREGDAGVSTGEVKTVQESAEGTGR